MNLVAAKVILNGDSVHMEQMGRPTPVTDESARKGLQEESIIFPELLYNQAGSGYSMKLTSIKNIDDVDAYELIVTSPSGETTTEYFDVKTGLKIRELKSIELMGANQEVSSDYKDYKEVNGILFPYTIHLDQGMYNYTLTISSLEVNSNIPDTDFK